MFPIMLSDVDCHRRAPRRFKFADAAATAAAFRLDESNIVLVKGVSALSGKRSFPASKRHTIASFCAVIEHSQVMVAQPHCPTQTLPAGFNYIRILPCSIGSPRRVTVRPAATSNAGRPVARDAGLSASARHKPSSSPLATHPPHG